MRPLSPSLIPACLLALTGCNGVDFATAMAEGADTGYAYGDVADEGGATGGDGAAPNDDGLGGEQESDFLHLLPAATDTFVFVANPDRDTVTRIDVETLEVITVEVGSNPAVVLTTPNYRRAVTFNQDSDDVSIVDADTLEVTDVPVRDGFNNMVMSPDGRWVITYHDQKIEEEADEPGGVSSYNEISLVDVEAAEHFPLVVGFQPKQVKFAANSGLATVVSDEYLAVIDLSAEEPVPVLVQIAEDLGDPPEAEEVVLTPDGGYALVRQYAVDELVVVDLGSLEVRRIPAGSNPTDLDLSPDGSFAVVVARGSSELYVYDIAAFGAFAEDTFAGGPAPTPEPTEVIALPDGEIIGSLLFDPSGDQAILYTTASPEARYSVWRPVADPSGEDIQVHLLEKPIRSMAITPTGESMLVFHTLEDAPEADPSSPFYGEEAMTIIDLSDFRSNPLLLTAPTAGYANSNDGRWGYFIMEDQPELVAIEYETLLYDSVSLYSPAIYVGVLPESTYAYVNQEHDLGRISFYEPDEAILETITGFELNAGIEH